MEFLVTEFLLEILYFTDYYHIIGQRIVSIFRSSIKIFVLVLQVVSFTTMTYNTGRQLTYLLTYSMEQSLS